MCSKMQYTQTSIKPMNYGKNIQKNTIFFHQSVQYTSQKTVSKEKTANLKLTS